MAFATNIAFLLILTVVVVSEPGTAEDAITVLKCCRNGEELQNLGEDNSDSTSGVLCKPSNNPWKPLIYSPSKRSMLSEIPLNWKVQEAKRPVCQDYVTPTYIPYRSSSAFILFEKGQAVLNLGNGPQIRPGKFCADSNALLVCLPKVEDPAAATMKPRVHRCCGEKAAYHDRACVNLEEDPDAPALLKNSSFVEMVQGFPTCTKSDNFTIVGSAEDGTLQPDGGLEIKGIKLPTGQFCVERIKGLDTVEVFVCSEHAPDRPIIVQKADIRYTLYASGFIISAVFLAATLAAGWLLPAAHHVLHWRCQTHHVACLMLGDILLAIIQIAGESIQGAACKSLAVMAHFFFLATFFWLNTMCFNIWWTFRDMRPTNLEKGQETLRLRIYACYAWGGPFLVAGIAALLDHLPPSAQETFLRPGFGENQCWFKDDAVLAYFFGPVGTLLAVNLLFFAATARELTCGLWKRDFVKSTTERAALGRVCMKLVIVMGITWVADVFSWAVGGPNYLWYFTDLINAFQGVFIFAVVACQPQVWAALKRLCNRNPRANAGRQGNALSTTSHGIPSMGDSVTQNPSTKTAPLETIC